MPVLKSSASDYTEFVRSNAALPVTGTKVKSTVTTVNVSVANLVSTASKVAVTVAPKTSILVAPTVKSSNANKGN